MIAAAWFCLCISVFVYAFIDMDRAKAASLLFFTSFAHFTLFDSIGDDVLYYVSACTTDVMTALCLIELRSRISLDLASISIASAVTNVIGLAMWFDYFSPNAYNTVIFGVSLLQITRLLLANNDGMAGGITVHRWNNLVPGHSV